MLATISHESARKIGNDEKQDHALYTESTLLNGNLTNSRKLWKRKENMPQTKYAHYSTMNHNGINVHYGSTKGFY